MMLKLPDLMGPLEKSKTAAGYFAEDLVDKLNSYYTVYLLNASALFLGGCLIFGQPIQCLLPAESTDSWRVYLHQYCYIQTEHRQYSNYTPRGFTTFLNAGMWQTRPVYYQWVPYILAVQAVLFWIPRWFWRFVGTYVSFGTDIETVMLEADSIGEIDEEETAVDKEKRLARFICEVVDYKGRKRTCGFSLTLAYVIRKWLMLLNVVFQFFFLAGFIGGRSDTIDFLWGFHLLESSMSEAVENPATGLFPNVIRCAINKYELGNHSNKTFVQCVLGMNFIIEKVFLLVYFWLLVLMVINLISAIHYTAFLTIPHYRSFVAEGLIPPPHVLMERASAEIGGPQYHGQGRTLLDFYVNSVLRTDGVLILMFIYNHSGAVIAFELIGQMWNIAVQPPLKEHELPLGTSLERMDAFGVKSPRLVDDNGNEIKAPRSMGEDSGFADPLKPSAPDLIPKQTKENVYV